PRPAQSRGAGRRDWRLWAIGGLATVAIGAVIIFVAIQVGWGAWGWRETPEAGLTTEQEVYNLGWGPFLTSEDPTIQVLSNPPVFVLVNAADPAVIHKKSIVLPKEGSKELFDLLKQTTRSEPEYLSPPKICLSPVSYTGIGEAIGAHLITG